MAEGGPIVSYRFLRMSPRRLGSGVAFSRSREPKSQALRLGLLDISAIDASASPHTYQTTSELQYIQELRQRFSRPGPQICETTSRAVEGTRG